MGKPCRSMRREDIWYWEGIMGRFTVTLDEDLFTKFDEHIGRPKK